jgi:hypothetical protein
VSDVTVFNQKRQYFECTSRRYFGDGPKLSVAIFFLVYKTFKEHRKDMFKGSFTSLRCITETPATSLDLNNHQNTRPASSKGMRCYVRLICEFGNTILQIQHDANCLISASRRDCGPIKLIIRRDVKGTASTHAARHA